jgi:hypothetical protein
MPTKASALKGRRTYVKVGIVEVDEDMTMKIEGGSCGVKDKDGQLIGTHKNEEGIQVFAGSKIYIQLAWLTLESIVA